MRLYIIFSLFIISIYSDYFDLERYGYKNTRVCTTQFHDFDEHNIELRKIKSFKGCTHIVGNIIIANITTSDKNAFDSLSEIREIYGYLSIINVNAPKLSFPELLIIRGLNAHSKSNSSFFFSENSIDEFDMRKLTSVLGGDVTLFNNAKHCSIGSTINWGQIIQKGFNINKRKSLIKPVSCDESATETDIKICNSICGNRGCWAQKYKAICLWEFNVPEKDATCLIESTDGTCLVCKDVRNGNQCDTNCGENFIIDKTGLKVTQNTDLKYKFQGFCLSKCPHPFLRHFPFCTMQCPSTHKSLGDECVECGNCLKTCNTTNVQLHRQGYLTQKSLNSLANCSIFQGSIELRSQSFKGNDAILGLEELEKLSNLEQIFGSVYIDSLDTPVKNLTFFKSLKTISIDKSEIFEPNAKRTALAAFSIPHKGIEYLGMKKLRNIFGKMVIAETSDVCYLEYYDKEFNLNMNEKTKSFENCKASGHVCHSECVSHLLCAGPGPTYCGHCCNYQAGEKCVSKCSDEPGYYLPVVPALPESGHFTETESECRTLPFSNEQLSLMTYEQIKSKAKKATECERCHPECKETCNGPNDNDCIGLCKNYKLDDRCVDDCGLEHYLDVDNYTCRKCHSSCDFTYASYGNVCSGPSNTFGHGGCSICEKVVKTTNGSYECVHACAPEHYSDSLSMRDFVKNEAIQSWIREDLDIIYRLSLLICKKCHEYCEECSGLGTLMPNCRKCKRRIFKDECVEQCPRDFTYEKRSIVEDRPVSDIVIKGMSLVDDPTTDESIDQNKMIGNYCQLCNDQCKNGCIGPSNNECNQCANKIIKNTNGTLTCVRECPADRKNTPENTEFCFNDDELSIFINEMTRKRILAILMILAATIVLVAIIALILFFFRKKAEAEKIKEELKIRFTNLDGVNLKNALDMREPMKGHVEMIEASSLIWNPSSKPLGLGAFGTVYYGKWNIPKDKKKKYKWPSDTVLPVAIKKINVENIRHSINSYNPNSGNNSKEGLLEHGNDYLQYRYKSDEILEEAKTMASVNHKHCLPLIGILMNNEIPCLVTAYLPHGNLRDYIRREAATLDSLTMLTWSTQIADGMRHLASKGIIHRDLAARNVLVNEPSHVQITDFGLAKILRKTSEKEMTVSEGKVPIRWLSLEVLRENKYSVYSDVWSYGITLWEIFTYGKRPYDELDTANVMQYVCNGGRLKQPDICTLDVFVEMIKCWMESPETRPTFNELYKKFNDFKKTPGNYLVIKNDKYGINVETPTNHYDEEVELRPRPLLASATLQSDRDELPAKLTTGEKTSLLKRLSPKIPTKSGGEKSSTLKSELIGATVYGRNNAEPDVNNGQAEGFGYLEPKLSFSESDKNNQEYAVENENYV